MSVEGCSRRGVRREGDYGTDHSIAREHVDTVLLLCGQVLDGSATALLARRRAREALRFAALPQLWTSCHALLLFFERS